VDHQRQGSMDIQVSVFFSLQMELTTE